MGIFHGNIIELKGILVMIDPLSSAPWLVPQYGFEGIEVSPNSLTFHLSELSSPTPKHVFEGGGYGKTKKHFSSSKIDSPGPPQNTFFDEGSLKNIGSMGRDIHPHRIFYFRRVVGGLIHFTGLVFPGSPGIPRYVAFFSGEYPSLEKSILGGLGRQKAYHFWQMDFIHLAKGFLGTPCKAYISAYFSGMSCLVNQYFLKNVHR